VSVRILPFGRSARLFELEAGDIRATVTDFGAALVTLHHPDGTNVVLGFDDVTGYQADSQFVGVIVGRYANRIAGGRFILDGQTWTLPCNDGPNHLHGGPDGFGRRLWKAEVDAENTAVQFSILSPHLDQGYPGAVEATAQYRIDNDSRLVLTLSATADRPTVVNLAPHAYFNLTGSGDIGGHDLRLYASRCTPVDDVLIPTGHVVTVDGSPFDLRVPRPFPPDIDMNFAIDGSLGDLRDVATVTHVDSQRCLTVRATAPGVQIYGGKYLADAGRFPAHAGFCIEPQYFPDAPNQSGFAAPRIDETREYREVVEYTLG
jgi:aldose 1-epimerase